MMGRNYMKGLINPTCPLCDAYYHFEGKEPMKLHGAMMHPYESYCIAGKRARRFRKSDPKRKPPAWCPKRKSPCEFRIYGFVSENAWLLHLLFARDGGDAADPLAHRYGLRYEGVTELTPKEFWQRRSIIDSEVSLPVSVQLYEVVEIDDGLKPVCFYKSQKGYRIVPYFRAADARKREADESELHET